MGMCRDVKVLGSTEERHDIHLLETVQKACQAGLKFNPDIFFIKKRQIEYFGRVITPQGVEPYPKKVKGITALVGQQTNKSYKACWVR